MNKIAILSGNKSVSRFFELEALYAELKPCVFEKSCQDLSEFLFTVIDVDTVKDLPDFEPAKTAFVSVRDDFPDFCKGALLMSWPVSVKTVKEIYDEIKHRILNVDKADISVRKDTVCFYKSLQNTVRYNGKNIFLSANEAKLLELLCRNSPNPVGRDMINKIFDAEDGNIADVYICMLRKKLENPFSNRLIFTVRNKGYKIIADMEWE